MEVLRKDNLVYLPVPKNASTMFIHTFEADGWSRTKIEDIHNDVSFFGHVQDPHVRHTKGVIEFLSMQGILDDVDLEKFALLLTHGIYDVHTYPISMLYPNLYEKAHWIPLDLHKDRFDANILTSYFLQKNGMKLKISKNQVIHPSPAREKEACNRLAEIKTGHPRWFDELTFWFLSDDIRIHSDSIQHYNSLGK